jgi:hypothetical protein
MATPIYSFELVLNVKQPDSNRSGYQHDGQLNQEVGFPADRKAR